MKPVARGFTLIEVLLAIGLLAVLLMLVSTALVATGKTLARAERFAAQLDEVRAAQQFLRRELQQAVPLPIGLTPSGEAAVFYGEVDELRYVASLPLHLGGGLYVQTLRLGAVGDEPRLEVAFTPFAASVTQGPWVAPQPLLRQARQLRLGYRGLDPQGRPTAWLPRWPWPERLPRQIEVGLQGSGPIPWPPLRVTLRLQPGALAGSP